MQNEYSIFISYKRMSLPIASLIYYKLREKGYSVFYDIKEMHPGEFDKQIFEYIDSAIDVIILIEKGSLDGWRLKNLEGKDVDEYKNDWFYKEVSYSFKKGKNIIPIWFNCEPVDELTLPPDVRKLVKFHSTNFSLYHIESSINDLLERGFIKSKAGNVVTDLSAFKLYSNRKCNVYNGKKIIGTVEPYSDEPLYYCVERIGDYRFRCVFDNEKTVFVDSSIGSNQEKIVDIKYVDIKNYLKYLYLMIGIIVVATNVYVCIQYMTEKGRESTMQRTREISENFRNIYNIKDKSHLEKETPEVDEDLKEFLCEMKRKLYEIERKQATVKEYEIDADLDL